MLPRETQRLCRHHAPAGNPTAPVRRVPSHPPGGVAGRSRRFRPPSDTGLRREQLAQLCGRSTIWHNRVEQDGDIAVAAADMARLAGALRLTAARRNYLFESGRRRDPAPASAELAAAGAPTELLAVPRVAAVPACLRDRLWHVRCGNDAAGRLFARWFDSGKTSLPREVFLSTSVRAFIWDWEHRRAGCLRSSVPRRCTMLVIAGCRRWRMGCCATAKPRRLLDQSRHAGARG